MAWWGNDFGDSSDFDPGVVDWGALQGLTDAVGPDLVLDTVTGQLVDASTIDPAEIADYGATEPGFEQPASPASPSKSDFLRSREDDRSTPGTETFDPNAMADPSASIASATSSPWLKSLAQGLGNLLPGTGTAKGLTSLVGQGEGGVSPGPGVGLMSSSTPGGGAPLTAGSGFGGQGGLASLAGMGLSAAPQFGGQDGLSAALSHLQADPGTRIPMQGAIDAGPPPVKFTPLQMPGPGGGVPMAAQPVPRLTGLQALLQERRG